MKEFFQDKVILITGASAGIGAALARFLAHQGGRIITLARRRQLLLNLAAELNRDDERVLAVSCDVSKDGDLERAVNLTRQKFGRIDIAIANAAIPMNGKFSNLTLDDYRRQMETNVFGVLRTAYACLDDLKQTHGTLVIIGSVMAYLATPGTSAYAMSKFAVRAFAETVRNELTEYNIRVVLLNPGFVQSQMRMVDNKGVYHAERKDWVPDWMVMPADKAAVKMARAIASGRREKFISFNGYLGYWVRQFMPWLYFASLNMGNRLIRG